MASQNLEKALSKTATLQARLQKLNDPEKLKKVQEATRAVSSIIGLGTLAGFTTKKALDSLRNNHKRRAMLEDLIRTDPVISQADKDEVLGYYLSIYQHAPKLASDKNVVRDLLRNAVRFERMDLQTIQTLAKTEKDLQSQKGLPNIGSLLK